MSRLLHLGVADTGKPFGLPLDAVTRTFGILAVRGAGKSNTGAVMAEEMFAASLPFVVIDPVGAWWGLRSSADGKSPGLAIPIFGGKHADVPLESGSGEMMADLITSKRLSCILDLREFESEAEKKRFLLAFARRLYEKNELPLHLFLEEADDYIPQKPMKDELHLLRAWENIVRRGRGRGLGMTLITQRSAVLNKNVLTQIETLFAMRTPGPQDIAAIEQWVKYQSLSKDLLASLSSLNDGAAWVWSPQWLKVIERVQMRRRATFDSGATPKHNTAIRPAATLADVDLAAVKEKMAATIEKAKAEDPAELRRRIATLEKELKAAAKNIPAAPPAQVIEKKVLLDGQLSGLYEVCEQVKVSANLVASRLKEIQTLVVEVRNSQAGIKPMRAVSVDHVARGRTVHQVREATVNGSRLISFGTTGHLPIGEKKVLTACIQHPNGLRREQLTILTGYKRSSRDAYIQRLREKELVATDNDLIMATEAGLAALPDCEPLPTGEELQEYYRAKLPAGERAILDILIEAYPGDVDREVLSERTGYQRSSRDAYLQRLRARELVCEPARGMVRASEGLFS